VAVAGVLFGVEVDYVPAQPVELIEQWFFDVVAFVEFDVRGCFVLVMVIPFSLVPVSKAF
jgi:hypothetical protein